MEERKAKLLEQLQRMKDGAKRNVDDKCLFYVMHAKCALEFAELAMEVIAQYDHNQPGFGEGFMSRLSTYTETRAQMLFQEGWFNSIAIGYGKIALEQMGVKRLRDFESAMQKALDLYTSKQAHERYNRIEKD